MSSSNVVVVTFDDRYYPTLFAKWTIENFRNITADVITSQIFSHKSFEVKWRLEIDNYVKDDTKYVRVALCTVAPVQVWVEFGLALEKNVKSDVFKSFELTITPNGFCSHESRAKIEDINNYLKPDGSLVCVAWINYAKIKCDRDWINNRITMSDELHQALDGKYTDITFKVDNMTIKAHKLIISRCQYFETMLDGNNVESKTGVIEITDFKFAVVRGLLEFIYTGWINLQNVNFAIDLRMAADKYDLPGLVKSCEQFIAWMLEQKDVTKAILSTTVLESMAIKRACAALIKSNPKDIVDCGDIFDNEELRVYLLKRNT